jgi:hypothetical protein
MGHGAGEIQFRAQDVGPVPDRSPISKWGSKANIVMPGLVQPWPPCAGHPRLVLASLEQGRRGWPGRSPAMTKSESFSSG